MVATEGREQRGQQIANTKGQVKRISEEAYKVKSQSGNGEYEILKTESGWMCSCPDHTYRSKMYCLVGVDNGVTLKL